MYVVSDADRKNADAPAEVYERFYFRHEAYEFLDEQKFKSVDGVVLFEEKHWVASDSQPYAYGPYGESFWATKIAKKKSSELGENFHTVVELERIREVNDF